ncbi:MAG: trimeric intracellular cation channel family protein [Clostridia bacterium]|nr:trimeric intracellular cation channel family protein [Clostridia bacterium]
MKILFTVLELIGVVAFAVSGAMVSVKKNMDIFGVTFLGLITAFGGGILRDTLIGKVPPAFFTNYWMVLAGTFTALIVFWVARIFRERYFSKEEPIEHINNVFDALGLGAFAVTGAQVTMAAGFEKQWLLVLLMGLLTAIGGGLLRDLMLREIPFVLNKRIYAIAALEGTAVYYVLHLLHVSEWLAASVAILVTFFMRLLATHFKWNLPHAIPNSKK